jgi:hypothetical protein
MDQFHTAFLYANNFPGAIADIATPLCAIILSIVLILPELGRLTAKNVALSEKTPPILMGLVFIIGVYNLLGTCSALAADYSDLERAYTEQRFQVVDGVVSVQRISNTQRTDLITIGGKSIYTVGYIGKTFGYNQSASQSSPLRNGVYARAYIYNGTILRIDLRDR